jgi:hypothetical protein
MEGNGDIHDKGVSRASRVLPALTGSDFAGAMVSPTKDAPLCLDRSNSDGVHASAGLDIHLREQTRFRRAPRRRRPAAQLLPHDQPRPSHRRSRTRGLAGRPAVPRPRPLRPILQYPLRPHRTPVKGKQAPGFQAAADWRSAPAALGNRPRDNPA